eukprot:sb/3474250/
MSVDGRQCSSILLYPGVSHTAAGARRLLQRFKPKMVQSNQLDPSNIRNLEYINYITYIYYTVCSSDLQSTVYSLTSYRVNWVQRQLLWSCLMSNIQPNLEIGQQITHVTVQVGNRDLLNTPMQLSISHKTIGQIHIAIKF